jgi:hypothetical protein
MGNFYVNHTVRTADTAAVVATLRGVGRKAWVAPSVDGQVVVYDEASDSQNTAEVRSLARLLSRGLSAACLAVLNHDDDVLIYELFEDGEVTEAFSSNPGFFTPPGPLGRGTRLCAVWGVPGAAFSVAALVRRRFTFAVELHAELAKAVGLPDHSVGTGFKYIEQGEPPESLAAESMLRVL